MTECLLTTKEYRCLPGFRYLIAFISRNKSDGQDVAIRKNQESRVHPLPHFSTFCTAKPRDCTRAGLNKPETRFIVAPASYLFVASESRFSKPHFPPCYCRYACVFIVSGSHSGAHLSSRLDTTCDSPFNDKMNPTNHQFQSVDSIEIENVVSRLKRNT